MRFSGIEKGRCGMRDSVIGKMHGIFTERRRDDGENTERYIEQEG